MGGGGRDFLFEMELLTATRKGPTTVLLEWDRGNDASDYLVYRRTDAASPWTLLEGPKSPGEPVPSNTYTDGNAPAHAEYMIHYVMDNGIEPSNVAEA